ncbi:MAG: helix-hairpin-helix domain-containing protein [Ruminococcus sp.]|nr:helix-hairpin-helix domain-containing protein [Ruminococcus sp.]
MERKGLLVICILSFIVFSASLLWRIISVKDESDVKITYTSYVVNEDEENETKYVSDVLKTTKATSEAKRSHKTTITSTEAVKEVNEPLYIDINSADFDELCLLDEIGEVLAEAIISYREENGFFNNIEEIMNVRGIGENTYEAICSYIYVENPIYPESDVSSDDNEEYDDAYTNEEEQEDDYVADSDEENVTDPPITLEEAAPIDLNTADLELLILLPHIDEDIAAKIIEMRESIGGFKNTYELLYIEGISREQADEILDYVCVEVDGDAVEEQ